MRKGSKSGLLSSSSLSRASEPFPVKSCSVGLVGLVADEGNNHAVKVEEKHHEVETKLGEGFLSQVSNAL